MCISHFVQHGNPALKVLTSGKHFVRSFSNQAPSSPSRLRESFSQQMDPPPRASFAAYFDWDNMSSTDPDYAQPPDTTLLPTADPGSAEQVTLHIAPPTNDHNSDTTSATASASLGDQLLRQQMPTQPCVVAENNAQYDGEPHGDADSTPDASTTSPAPSTRQDHHKDLVQPPDITSPHQILPSWPPRHLIRHHQKATQAPPSHHPTTLRSATLGTHL